MPTRQLPARPSIVHLKHQAGDLLDGHRSCNPQVLQRLREFHPRMRGLTDADIAALRLKTSDAYVTIAREYGFPSWPKLKAFIERERVEALRLPVHERIDNPAFRHAVDLIDAGDVSELQQHLARHPGLVRQRLTLYGGNYFQTPSLLEFIAENPVRRGTLPENIADVARAILDASAREDRAAMNSALDLIASSSVARECGVQRALIDLLVDYGADPDAGMLNALMYGEFDGAGCLLARGARMTLTAAAALDRVVDVQRLAPAATDEDRRLALALAAQHGRMLTVQVLLEAGADPSGFTPPPGHSHATPLHQAAGYGHAEIARLLVQNGARLDLRDVLYNGTPADWADHMGHADLADELRKMKV